MPRSTLREEGFSGRIVLIGREPGIPFGRPPLSKTYLRSEEDLGGWYVKPSGWYEEHRIERLVGASVVEIDPIARSLVLDSGQALAYDKLLDSHRGPEPSAGRSRCGAAGNPLSADGRGL